MTVASSLVEDLGETSELRIVAKKQLSCVLFRVASFFIFISDPAILRLEIKIKKEATLKWIRDDCFFAKNCSPFFSPESAIYF